MSENSTSGRGVGIFLGVDVNAQIDSSTIEKNLGLKDTSLGGGIFAGDFVTGQFKGNTIVGNVAQQGGGIFLSKKTTVVVIDNKDVSDNEIKALPGEGGGEEEVPVRGAGILSLDSASPFRGNTIINNKVTGATEETGGLHLVNPFLKPEVSNNTIQGNGGGSQLVCTPVGAEIVLEGNTIPAGGIFGCRNPVRR